MGGRLPAGALAVPASDGGLARDGMVGAMLARLTWRMAKRFDRMDANGDGAIARSGFEDMGGGRFRRLDAGVDGAVTRGEVEDGLRHRGG